MAEKKKIILTGDRPTGKLHIGHYAGSLKRRVELQNSGEYDKIFIMIADAQALTDNADNPAKIRQSIMEVALDYLSIGIDPAKSTIFCPVAFVGADGAVVLLYESRHRIQIAAQSDRKSRDSDA